MKPALLTSSHLEQCFAEDYRQARERFIAASQGLRNHSSNAEFVYRERGPSNEKLITSLVWQGRPAANRVLVIQSATHGVEGFAGSAIQTDNLISLPPGDLDEDTAILYIHALNPYGFAWLRRVNEDGVDLNRNMMDFSKPLPKNPDYDRLADDLLPTDESEWEAATQRLEAREQEVGQHAFELAVTGGQYDHPDGLFYGGRQASQSRLNLQEIITRYELDKRERVAVIDVHTGLGPFGYGEVICDHPPGSQGVAWARQWYGDSVTEPALGTSSSVPKGGLIDFLWHESLPDRVCFITLEFGTYPMDKLLDVLRRDHCLHRQPVDWQAPGTQAIKAAIKKNFYPATPDWQEMVLLRGRQVIRQALEGLR